jgi:hypothetical protein
MVIKIGDERTAEFRQRLEKSILMRLENRPDWMPWRFVQPLREHLSGRMAQGEEQE